MDDERILIIGGCGGPNKQYEDIWILNWPKDYNLNASWQQIHIQNHINSPSQLYCMSFVKCENKLVTFGKPRMSSSTQPNYFIGFGDQNTKNENYDNSNNCPMTIYGLTKTAQPRKCSCSSNLNLEKKLENSNDNKSTINSFTSSDQSLSSNQAKTTENKDNQYSTISNNNQITILNKSQRNTIKR